MSELSPLASSPIETSSGLTLPGQIKFSVTHQDTRTRARRGLLQTPHGVVETPVFMPVGTLATVKGLTQADLEGLGAQIILGNTYHLFLRPGEEVIRELGGLHRFMSWPRAILTDSGGFQVYSLSHLRKVREQGVEFRSHLNGSKHELTPERAVEIQWKLGSDVAMVLDECTEFPATEVVARKSMELTLRWAARSQQALQALRLLSPPDAVQIGALFGIVQGGTHPELRRDCARALVQMEHEGKGLDGFAIGGLSVGESRPITYDLAAEAAQFLPHNKPRYVMGVGLPEELPQYVALGIDMMDCVLPTRNGRNGYLFTSQGRVHIRQARFTRDPRPLDESCACLVCRRYSRAYLRHLFISGEMLGRALNSYHNLFFYLDTMRRIRETIASGEFDRFLSDFTPRVQGEAP
ncbi:MAG: tRNA guanosine(34) transglycosylase Tgt [Acidobacteria bacterium]|nr:tRNA guanosine(34) transglycosylase Tgt [Acidobacteriota bacterium]